MDDPYSKLKPGDLGTVDAIDDTGTIFCKWDNGSGLGLVYGADYYKIINPALETEKSPNFPNVSSQYSTGADFWHDNIANHGIDKAHVVCGNYFDTQLRSEQAETEKAFFKQLFIAIHKYTNSCDQLSLSVYPHDFQTARKHNNEPVYHKSMRLNLECAECIDNAINASCYKLNHYNLDLAAMAAIHRYGFERITLVLAKTIQSADSDGRYSKSNKLWASSHNIPSASFDYAQVKSHPVLVDSFTTQTRRLFDELKLVQEKTSVLNHLQKSRNFSDAPSPKSSKLEHLDNNPRKIKNGSER